MDIDDILKVIYVVLVTEEAKNLVQRSPKTNLDARKKQNPVSMVTEARSRCPEEQKYDVRGNRRPISMPERSKIRCPW